MKLKSLFGAFVALSAMALMAVGVQAATTFSVGTVAGSAGVDVTVPVCVTADDGSTDQVSGYIMKITYNPNEVTPVASATNDATDATCYATVGANYTDGILVADITSTSETENVLTVAWASANAVTVTDTADVMATVDFDVDANVTSSPALGVEVAALTKDGETLADGTTYSAGSGEITIDTGILGDVDGNEKINSLDSTLLFQYVSGAIDLVELKSQVLDPDNVEWRSDINGDTKINSIDSTLLFQYVSGASSSVTGD